MGKTRDGAYKCRGGFVAVVRGRKVVVRAGALVPYEVPYDVMDGREELFDDIGTPRVEQASAGPGEKRSVPSRPRKKRKPAEPKAEVSPVQDESTGTDFGLDDKGGLTTDHVEPSGEDDQ